MATFDISRVAFDPQKHYSSVRMQQGRVLTDDDWNENERVEGEEQRRTQVDVIGGYGTPDNGFLLTSFNQADGLIDFTIKEGTIYVGGIRFEMDADETFRLQKDWLQKDDDLYKIPLPAELTDPGRIKFDLVYLETWQQPVSAVEDNSIQEIALGGPDTTTRVRNMRRINIYKNTHSPDCAVSWEKLKDEWKNIKHLGTISTDYELQPDTKLRVSFVDAGAGDDLCSPRIAGGYLGAENQAIRVQLTTANKLIWGFDNASPLYRIRIEGTAIEMTTLPKDQYHWPVAGQAIEILPWSAILPNHEKVAEHSGYLRTVSASYNPVTHKFSINAPLFSAAGELLAADGTVLNPDGMEWEKRLDSADIAIPERYFFMRVWNRGDDFSSPPEETDFTIGTPLTLGQTGIQVTISGTDMKPGDFWVIAARPETPKKVYPWELENGISPHGVRQFLAPLGIIRWTIVGETVLGEIIRDCRKPFKPLTDLDCKSCSIVIDPKPGWENIFERLNNDSKVIDIQACFKPGNFTLTKPLVLRNKRTIKFTGCGEGSIIIINESETAVVFDGCAEIIIRDLSFRADGRNMSHQTHLSGVLSINDCGNVLLENINARCEKNPGQFKKEATCVSVTCADPPNELVKSVIIRNSEFHAQAGQTGILIVNMEDVFIHNNQVRGIPDAKQGIVVGGNVARNINIADNHIDYVAEAIHVGVSRNRRPDGSDDTATYFTDSITISGNKIGILLPRELRSTQGIFVGNFDHSLVIKENVIDVITSRESPFNGVANGIRVHGFLGKIAILRNNYAIDPRFKPGILIKYLGDPAILRKEKVIWIAEQNYARVLATGVPASKFIVRENY